jgi:hypothetical protein
MRSIAIGLAAALFAAALSPVAAFAADKPSKADAAKAAQDVKTHAQGMAEGPPLAQQMGLPCTITDANYLGSGKAKGADGKESVVKLYELVCQEGLGYMVQSQEGAEPMSFDCFGMLQNMPKAGAPDTGRPYCKLPANADPLKGVQAMVAKAGVKNCTVDRAIRVGYAQKEKVDQWDIGCAEGNAFQLLNPRIGSTMQAVSTDCILLDPGRCQFFPKDKLIATLAKMSAPAQRTKCQITDGRYIGTNKDSNDSFFEVACADQTSGFIMEAAADGRYVRSFDCARASSIAGGCTLTVGAAAQTEEIATYARLAKQIGYDCDVKAYHSFGPDRNSGREIVELACNNHPEGGIALLPVEKDQKGEYFNCARAGSRSLKCSLSQPEATNALLTSQITALGRNCQVTKFQGIGQSPEGADYVEVACAPPGVGQVLEYVPNSEKLKAVIPCLQAKDACKMK